MFVRRNSTLGYCGKKIIVVKMMSYPKYHGSLDKGVISFLENLELTCISNHIQDCVKVLCFLRICLIGDVRTWLKDYESGLGDDVLNVEEVKTTLTNRFVKVEDPKKFWHDMQADREVVEIYVKMFLMLWKSLRKSLPKGQVPLYVMKKDKFCDRP